MNKEIYEKVVQTVRLGNRAVHQAQEENRRLGIPNVYSKNGKLYFEMPDGRITDENPFEDDK